MRKGAMGVLLLCIAGLVIVPFFSLDQGLAQGLRVGLGLIAIGSGIALGTTKPREQTALPPVMAPPTTPPEEPAPVAKESEPTGSVPPAPARLRRPKRAPLAPRRPRRPARSEQEAIQRLEQAQRELEAARKRCEAERHALRQQEVLERNLFSRLRNTLAIINGYGEILDKEVSSELTAQQQEYIRIIRQRTRQSVRLIEDLETLLQAAESLAPRGQVDLIKLVEDTLLTFEPECRALRLTLRKDIMLSTPPIQGNAQHLRHVLENLLSNALKFTPEGGMITVRLAHEGKQAILQVQDTGVGIPKEALERIFERFYQVANASLKRGGSGLGLALVKEVVQAHGGTVEVESTVNLGTCFTVRLPIQE